MSEFRQQIEKAARRQRFFLLAFAVVGIGSLVVIAALFGLMKVSVIHVGPAPAAEQAVIKAGKGMALYFQGSLFSLSRFPTVIVAAEGYETAERVIEPIEEGHEVAIMMRELPAELTLRFANLEEPVSWYVNDRAYPSAATFSAKLAAGQYVVRAEHPYYIPLEKTYDLGRGESLSEDLTLEKASGSIHIDVTPADAHVLLDGRAIGKVPADLAKEAGRYEIEISRDGYAPIVDTIDLTFQQKGIERHYQLQLQPAYVSVSVSPNGGQLTLNGKSVAPGQELQLSANKKYYLKYGKDGYGAMEEEVTLNPAEHRKVAFNLKLKIGEVHISSSPAANVMIDGKPAGNTPLKVRLPAVMHEFSIEKQGYRSIIKSLRPDPAAVRRIDVVLQTEQAATLAAAKPVYKNSLGMEMRLFAPNNVMLGAPRYEKGQRANEFLRDVTLKRHFYAAATETTEGQYSKFKPAGKAGDKFPVTGISWEEAAQFCNWLGQREGLAPFYRFDGTRYRGFDARSTGYRLLSEAEWEWLARKAGRSKESIFPWGDEAVIPKGTGNIADETANGKTQFYVPGYVDGYAGIAPIESFNKDRAGLYDLFGNVSEWVHDFYILIPPLKGQTFTDPLGEQTGEKHVIKGASWASGTLTEIRPAYRASSDQGSDKTGFRVGRYLYGDVE